MKQAVISILKALIYPAIYIGSQVLVMLAAMLAFLLSPAFPVPFHPDNADRMVEALSRHAADNMQMLMVLSCALTILVLLLIFRVSGRNPLREWRVRPLPFATVLVLLLTGIVLNLLTSVILSMIPIPEQVLEEYNSYISDNVVGGQFWLSTITTVLLVPLTEEMVFRGMSHNTLRRGMPLWVALLLQAAIFAAVHVLPLQMAYVFFAGFTIGLVYHWQGSFLAPLLVHISYNGVGVLLSLIPVEEPSAPVEPASPLALLPFLLVGAVLLASCLFFLYRRRERETPQPRDGEPAL